jgi:hypothetical protein
MSFYNVLNKDKNFQEIIPNPIVIRTPLFSVLNKIAIPKG